MEKGTLFWRHSFFFFFLTFISIYFMLNLLPGHKLLFLQFLLGYLFLLGSPSSGLGTRLSFSGISSVWWGE